MKLKIAYFTISIFTALSLLNTVSAVDSDPLSTNEISLVKNMLEKLKPYIDERKSKGNLNLLGFEELYSKLDPSEKEFMVRIRNTKPLPQDQREPLFEPSAFVAINDQKLIIPDPTNPEKNYFSVIERQFLPKKVFEAYVQMMNAMEKDLGKRLYVESGYRSPAYQLYLFVFYLQNHDYSIKETNRWVALPGFSEHGAPERQAIDFITREGISGENHPEDFENVPEYNWLTQNANRFGFVLSYPKNNTTNSAFEPWHWRYEPSPTQETK